MNFKSFFKLLPFEIILILASGCNESQTIKHKEQASETTRYFNFKALKADGFYVLSSSLDNSNKPRRIKYLFNGSVTNNSNRIFAKGTIDMELYIELENGNILREKDIDESLLSGLSSLQSFQDWRPGASITLRQLQSYSIPVSYFDYPIKNVYLDLKLDAMDQVNNENVVTVMKTASVLRSWKDTVKKIRINKVDATDSYFPQSVLVGDDIIN